MKWWKQHSDNLPNWSSAVMKVLLVQPSSAAADHERVFSLLNASFDDLQDHALVDYLQASVMLQYNKREDQMQCKAPALAKTLETVVFDIIVVINLRQIIR